ncbi:MAG: COX15/CtaA family protein [Pirellulaceae bacterium]|nr:COX15/CtaA family protein [Pirellulaceae bacterium]
METEHRNLKPVQLDQPNVTNPSFQSTHRWALSVAMTIFPLIWVGGLVTTQDAGMAVPDWPNTYGYNMFAYPISAWIYGPFDLFIEHGHRLLGSLAGMLAIGLCIVAWRNEQRQWLRWLCIFLLLSIVMQGLLGGLRVRLDARTLAMLHGCLAPLVFALAIAVVVMTSRWWKEEVGPAVPRPFFRWLAIGLTISAFVQLFLGAQLRHIQPWAKPASFTGLVHLHLTFAAIVSLLVISVAVVGQHRTNRQLKGIGWPTFILIALLLIQIALGVGTWISNYALPWGDTHPMLARYTIATKGFTESWIVTGHQATGSLIIATALILTLRVWRRSAHKYEK